MEGFNWILKNILLLFFMKVFWRFLQINLTGELKLKIKLFQLSHFYQGFSLRLTTTECVDVDGLRSLLLMGLLVKNLLDAQACFISNKLILVISSDIRRHFLKQSMELVSKISLKICIRKDDKYQWR